MRVAVVIPARNEAPTVGDVVRVAREAALIDEVIVVDNGSDDGTGDVAAAAGARVLGCADEGKGQAMAAGVAATDADVLVFLDADLVGLTPDHVDRLAEVLLEGAAVMACGLFDRGRAQNPVFLHGLPILTGQRALRREIWDALEPEDYRGYKVEAALNSVCNELGVPIIAFVCEGLWHRTKEEKFANPVEGFARKQAMLLTAVWGYASYRLRRMPGSRRRRREARERRRRLLRRND
jgi:glycosyltransferase involved in cell wall biosynthesis